MRNLAVFLLFNLLASPGTAATLESDTTVATAGFFQLKWEVDGPVRLVESETADFLGARTIYLGADAARVISGKPDGEWYYRLEKPQTGERLSDPVLVQVRHHSLRRALSFFGLGALVFVATLGLIVFGSRTSRG